MSRIFFHSPSGTAELLGSERAYMGCFCTDMLLAALHVNNTIDCDWIRPLLPTDHYLLRLGYLDFNRGLCTHLSVGDSYLVVNGTKIDVLSLALNTAALMGNAAIKLMARLHGQCEIHCYVKGENRAWLARIIRRARDSNLFRVDQGWESVAELLENRKDEPVVCSYSVCNAFPNEGFLSHLKQRILSENPDAFNEWTPEMWWDACLPQLYAIPSLELKPETFSDYKFDHGLDGFALKARYWSR